MPLYTIEKVHDHAILILTFSGWIDSDSVSLSATAAQSFARVCGDGGTVILDLRQTDASYGDMLALVHSQLRGPTGAPLPALNVAVVCTPLMAQLYWLTMRRQGLGVPPIWLYETLDEAMRAVSVAHPEPLP